MIEMSEPVIAALIGGFGGALLGLAARLGRFCSLGAVEDALYGGSYRRAAQWAVAVGVALLGVASMTAVGWFLPGQSHYLTEPFSPLVVAAGGLVFGYGMALAGTCGFGALARVGGGDIRALVIVLVIGIFALITVSGPLAGLRVALVAATEAAALPRGATEIAARAGLDPAPVLAAAGLVALALGCAVPTLRRSPSGLVWASVAGAAIVSAWAGTAWLAREGFDALPVVSHTYSAPIGDSLIWVMTSSGGGLSFGVGSVAGVVAGSFLGSMLRNEFRWEACEDPRELRRQIAGAAMMGVGAVLALGCTVGQGLSAFSVLALSAPLAVAAIVLGAGLGLRHLIVGRLLPG